MVKNNIYQLIMKQQNTLIILAALLFCILISCKRPIEKRKKENISYKLFTSNCGVSIRSVKDSLERVLRGYPAGYQLRLSDKKIGIVIDEEKGEILSTINTIEFDELDSLSLNRFLKENNVILIGDGVLNFERGGLFNVQQIEDNRVYTCHLKVLQDRVGYVLDMRYDCIKGLE